MKRTTNHVTRTISLRRKREGKTNYKQRLAFLKGEEPRLVVRKSLHHLQAQLIEYVPEGDKVLVTAHTKELKAHGYSQSTSNMCAAYLLGALIAKKAKQKKIGSAILDLGLQTKQKGGKLYAVLKGAVDGGLDIPHGEEILPTADRISGKHLHHSKAKVTQTEFEKAKGALL